MKTTIIGLAVVTLLVGCGGGDGGPSGPTVHSISDRSQRAESGTRLPIGPFALPEGATVTYNIVDMPTGIGDDRMDCVVAAHSDVQAGQDPLSGFGVRTGVSSTGATTPPLPADDYDLVVICRNISDECFFTATVSATF